MSSAPTTVLFDVPGSKARVRHLIIGIVGAVGLLVFLGFLVYGLGVSIGPIEFARNANNPQFTADKWLPFVATVNDDGTWVPSASTWTNYLLPGLLKTLSAALLAIVFSLIIGVLLGIGRLSQLTAVRVACGLVVEFFRAVPVLVLMIFAYYLALYVLHLTESQPFFGVVVGLVLYNGSVIAELIRSGVGSLPGGQREAGLAIGLTDSQTMWTVLLPQAITAMLPSLVSQLVVVLKDTALGYIISYSDFIRAGQTMSNLYGNLIPTMIVMAAVFIVINYALTRLARWLERFLQRSRGSITKPGDALIDNPAEAAGAGARAAQAG
jgi:glutamate transport system permease protein